MRIALLLSVVVILSSCGSGAMKLYRAGATDAEMKRDGWECQQQVVTMYGGMAQMGIGHAMMARGDIVQCLEARGYQMLPQDEIARLRAAESAK